ncbi:hypothetical protein J2S58_000352 [Nakamurella flavida]|nr:hypothetical protein [Nakamurella flavida]
MDGDVGLAVQSTGSDGDVADTSHRGALVGQPLSVRFVTADRP